MGIKVEHNHLVVALLEKWLAIARKGQINFCAIVTCQPPDIAGADFAGAGNMDWVARTGIELLIEGIDGMLKERVAPPADPALGADYACFNLASGPASYDILPWLIDAEMNRIRHGAPAPLKVHFWMGEDGTGGLNSPPMRRIMFENVLRPALALIGAVETDKVGFAKEFYSPLDIVTASRAGVRVPLFHAPYRLDLPYRPVTITLREAEMWPHRNSNFKAWLKFADWLKERGENVVFVRDTAKANVPVRGHSIWPKASLDLIERMALYESAKCNLFVSNGPCMLAAFSDRPYITFCEMTDDDHPYQPQTEKFVRENMGMERGDQWPWARPDQHIIWEKDSYETILAAWQQHMGGGDALEKRQRQSNGIGEHPRATA